MNNSNSLIKQEICFPDIKIGNAGKPLVLNTADNLATLIQFYGYEAKLNLMTLETEIFHKGKCLGSPDTIKSKIISLCSLHSVPRSAIDDHLLAIAQENTYHPVLCWLEQDTWDQIYRVDDVINCLQAKYPEMTNFVLKRWLVGCIASLVVPNFKSKLVPILLGEQSVGKTSFIERIATVTSNSFLEGAELNPDNKDSVLSCIKSWITELGELERTTSHSQGSLKAFMTKSTDTVRPPYARLDVKKPRQTSIIASVNGADFLRDRTGNARYAVIELTGKTDMNKLNALLGWKYNNTGELTLEDGSKLRQFWLEVRHQLEVESYGWNLMTDEQALVDRQNQKYVDKGDYYAVLHDYIMNDTGSDRTWFTSSQICNRVGIHVTKSNVAGKALTMLVQEGIIERKFSGGVNRYLFPV